MVKVSWSVIPEENLLHFFQNMKCIIESNPEQTEILFWSKIYRGKKFNGLLFGILTPRALY